MKKSVFSLAILGLFASTGAWAQASGEFSSMPECTGPCSYQVIGDTSDAVDNSTSNAKQLNPSSTSNVSSGAIEADQRLQQSGNRLGDATASGGTAAGNRTDVDASSKASNGDMSGFGGSAVTGDSSAAIGDIKNVTGPSTAAARGGDQSQGIKDSGNSSAKGGNATQAQGIRDSGNAAQGQGQGQGQAQGIKDSGNAAQGQAQGIRDAGNAAQGQSAEIDASDHSQLSVDASDRSSHSTEIDARSIYYPPVFHQAPSQLATPAMLLDKSGCGPVMDKTREQALGVFHGYFGQNQVDLGWDDDLVAVPDPDTGLPGYYYKVRQRDGSQRLFGTQVASVYAVIGVAGGRSLSLFGASNRGGAGELGTSGNSTMQRLVARHTLIVCDAGTIRYELPTVRRVAQ